MTAKSIPPPMELPPELSATYSNLVRITHTPAELILDFAQLLPAATPGARVMARILMSPVGAKLFYRALGENLARYETTFGEINLPRDNSLANDLFKSVHPPEPPPDESK